MYPTASPPNIKGRLLRERPQYRCSPIRKELTVKIARLAVGLVIWAAVLSTAASAQTAVVTSTIAVSAPGQVHDDCTKEDVIYSGTIELVTNVWVDANGTTHIRTKTPNVNIRGVGVTSGNDYIVQVGGGDVYNGVENTTTEPRPWEFSTVSRMALIGLGPVPNERVQILFHQTLNPDGTTTAEVDQFVMKCNGK